MINPEERKDAYIIFRVTITEKKKIKEQSNSLGLQLSDYLRKLIRKVL